MDEDPVWTTIRIRLMMTSIILIPLSMIFTIRFSVSVISTTSLLCGSSMSESSLSSRQDPPPAKMLSGGVHLVVRKQLCCYKNTCSEIKHITKLWARIRMLKKTMVACVTFTYVVVTHIFTWWVWLGKCYTCDSCFNICFCL